MYIGIYNIHTIYLFVYYIYYIIYNIICVYFIYHRYRPHKKIKLVLKSMSLGSGELGNSKSLGCFLSSFLFFL